MAYVQHRMPCCRATWEQKHLKNLLEEETSIPNNVIKYTASLKLVETDLVPSYPNGSSGLRTTLFNTTITSHTFENGIGTITFEEDVTEIKAWAFYNNIDITSIMIPDSVTNIGEGAFYRCIGLTSITIGNSVTSIGDGALSSCDNLTSITSLAATAPIVQNNTFENMSSNGTLYTPLGSTGYDTWMGTGNYYLGKYNWTKVEQ